ncbi:MAG TPA: hypothetical protein VNL15_00895 [Dehalococcoidia bacterium]|nr:hypothetical protein [Dehalococcoidia bacterium]
MVYLPEELHEGLRQLAFEHRTSMAHLIRRAVEIVYGETIEDIRDGEAGLADYLANPASAMPLEEFLKQLETSVPSRSRVARSTRA